MIWQASGVCPERVTFTSLRVQFAATADADITLERVPNSFAAWTPGQGVTRRLCCLWDCHKCAILLFNQLLQGAEESSCTP